MNQHLLSFTRRAALAIAGVGLAACSTPAEYQAYVAAHQSQAQASSQAAADVARYNALAQIASNSADPTSMVAAVMALAMDSRGTGRQTLQQPQIAAPVSNAEIALRWAQVVVPGVTAIYGIRANALTAMNASDNAAATSIATTQGFVVA